MSAHLPTGGSPNRLPEELHFNPQDEKEKIKDTSRPLKKEELSVDQVALPTLQAAVVREPSQPIALAANPIPTAPKSMREAAVNELGRTIIHGKEPSRAVQALDLADPFLRKHQEFVDETVQALENPPQGWNIEQVVAHRLEVFKTQQLDTSLAQLLFELQLLSILQHHTNQRNLNVMALDLAEPLGKKSQEIADKMKSIWGPALLVAGGILSILSAFSGVAGGGPFISKLPDSLQKPEVLGSLGQGLSSIGPVPTRFEDGNVQQKRHLYERLKQIMEEAKRRESEANQAKQQAENGVASAASQEYTAKSRVLGSTS